MRLQRLFLSFVALFGLLATAPVGSTESEGLSKSQATTEYLVSPPPSHCLLLLKRTALGPPVKQCGGSCNFETFLAATEYGLSERLGHTLQLSRPYYFATLLEIQADNLLATDDRHESYSLNDKAVTELPKKAGMIYDLAKTITGSVARAALGRRQQGYLVVKAKSPAEALDEEKIIRQLHREVGELLYDYYLFYQKYQEGQINSLALRRRKQGLLPQVLGLTEAVKQEAELVAQPDNRGLFAGWEIIDQNLPLEFDQESQLLTPESEELTVEALERGHSIRLAYRHLPESLRSEGAFTGVLNFFESEDRAKENFHAVLVVDVLRDSKKRIRYLVARNSHGRKVPHNRSFMLIDVHYLAKTYRASDSLGFRRKPGTGAPNLGF